MKPQCAPSQSPEDRRKCFYRKKFTPPGSCVNCNTFVDRGFAKYVYPDSRTRAMLFLIPDCVARPMPDSRSPAMCFSFPDYAKWAMTDSRPGVISFSIPDYARELIPKSESLRKRKKTPSRGRGLGDTRCRERAAIYWTLAVLFTAPRSSRCSSLKARLPDFSSGCFSKTT